LPISRLLSPTPNTGRVDDWPIGRLIQPNPEQQITSYLNHSQEFDADRIMKEYIEYCDDQLQRTLSKLQLASRRRKSADLSHGRQPNRARVYTSRKRDRSASPVKAKQTLTPPPMKKRRGHIYNSSSSESDFEEDESQATHSDSDSDDDSTCGTHGSASDNPRQSDSSKTPSLSN